MYIGHYCKGLSPQIQMTLNHSAIYLQCLWQENSNLTKWGEAATAIQEFGQMEGLLKL